MSSFNFDAFTGDYPIVVSKERYTEQEAIEIAKRELGVDDVSVFSGYVRYEFGVDPEKVNNLTKCYDAYETKIQEGDILYGMSNSSYCGIKGVVTYESGEECFVLLNHDELYYLNPKMCRHFEIMGNKLNNPEMIDDLFEPLDY